MVGLDPDISDFAGGEKCRIENNVKIVCFIIFIVNNETSRNLFHSQQCHHQFTKAQRFPCENSKRWGREDVNEKHATTAHEIVQSTKKWQWERSEYTQVNQLRFITFFPHFLCTTNSVKRATAQCVANQQETSADGQGPRGSGNRKMVETHTGDTRGKPRIQDLLGSLVSHARLSARASQNTNSLTLERPPL